ncbi:MAG: MoxR family ATPase [Zoogloeaceae bacterium]|jgi:MoxR-like ATPase|nr:MoxR family ATPase [Zoogloeaceae bacterium]
MSVPSLSALQGVVEQTAQIILGKRRETQLALTCLLARGHLLIEDLPGLGKTTLAQTLAQLLGLGFTRVQFTSDLLPADILGLSLYVRESGNFRFMPGPIFTQMLLADEINRATPKTQSALLEAMEERQVTSDGETRALPQPFFVIATQNPAHQIGTFPLPESQLDRFLLRLSLGYPDTASERALLAKGDTRQRIAHLTPLLSPADLQAHQAASEQTFVAPALLDYVQALLAASRANARFFHGLSPRAGLFLLAAARAWAYLDGRKAVLPDDIQTLLPGIACHRLRARQDDASASLEDIEDLLHSTPIP